VAGETLDTSSDPVRRYLAYVGTGLSGDREAVPFLLAALEKEDVVLDAVGGALLELKAREAIPDLDAAYRRWTSPHAPELADVIGRLAHPDPDADVLSEDWRFRYRPLPPIAPVMGPSWYGMGALMHSQKVDDREGDWRTKKPLADILRDRQTELKEGREPSCSDCRETPVPDCGVPVCRCMRSDVRDVRRDMWEDLRRRGAETLFDARDQEDLRRFDILNAPGRARDDGDSDHFEHAVRIGTLEHLIRQGVKTLDAGEKLISP
jgi:hypothetical protein